MNNARADDPSDEPASLAGAALAGVVRTYQLTIRPVIGGHCRFEPSCSHYAIEALRRHGAWRGAGLSVRRILSCNPWHEGGFDPVPRPEKPSRHAVNQRPDLPPPAWTKR